jgi:hypothetical protein
MLERPQAMKESRSYLPATSPKLLHVWTLCTHVYATLICVKHNSVVSLSLSFVSGDQSPA